MRVLFLHNNFPAQFRHTASLLAANPKNQILFATKNAEVVLPNIRKVLFQETRPVTPETHNYVKPLELAVLNGQAVFRLAEQLKAINFVPDVIVGHSGWGPTLFLKDAFPHTPLMCYFEWFYHGVKMLPHEPFTLDDLAKSRVSNAPILIDLYSCDWGLCPTQWQYSQFPPEYQTKLTVLHDGIDTNFFKPNPGAKLVLPNLDLSHGEEIVTYVSRGMEPYRGFPQFIEAIALLLERRPQTHVVIVASERVCYGVPLPDGMSYKEYMLKKVPLDLSRVHFVGTLPYNDYLKVIQASSAHIYLTVPFILSWSLMESLSTGCLVIASDTAPVREVITHGENGLLVDLLSPKAIADTIEEVLKEPQAYQSLREKARQTIVEAYSHDILLPKQIKLLENVAQGNFPVLI